MHDIFSCRLLEDGVQAWIWPAQQSKENLCFTRPILLLILILHYFHSSLYIFRSSNQIFFHRMESAPGNFPRKFPFHLFPFLNFRNFSFNEKRPKTRAYNESINYCVLFALSQRTQLVIFSFFLRQAFYDTEVLKVVL